MASDKLHSDFASLIGGPKDELANPALGFMDTTLNSAEVCSDLATTFVTPSIDPELVCFDDLIEL